MNRNKEILQTIGFATYLIAIVIIVSYCLVGCSSGSYTTCAAYNNIELEVSE